MRAIAQDAADPALKSWRAERTEKGNSRGRKSCSLGWLTADEAGATLWRLYDDWSFRPSTPGSEAPAEPARPATLGEIIDLYLEREATRVEHREDEVARGEEAVRKGRMEKVPLSPDGLGRTTYDIKVGCRNRLEEAGWLDKGLVALSGTERLDLKKMLRSDRTAAQADKGGPPPSTGGMNNEIVLMTGAWNWCLGRRRIAVPAPEWPKFAYVPVRDKQTPTRPELNRVLDALRPDDSKQSWAFDVLYIQARVGCRIGALANLEKGDVKLKRGRVRLNCKGHDRTIDVKSDVIDVLRPYVLAAAPGESIWRKLGGELHNRTLAHATVRNPNRRHLRPACEAAGVTPFTTHGIRRLVVAEWLCKDVPVHVFQRILGHSAKLAIEVYAKFAQGNDRDWFDHVDGVPMPEQPVEAPEERMERALRILRDVDLEAA